MNITNINNKKKFFFIFFLNYTFSVSVITLSNLRNNDFKPTILKKINDSKIYPIRTNLSEESLSINKNTKMGILHNKSDINGPFKYFIAIFLLFNIKTPFS